jgi:hypothetical protein
MPYWITKLFRPKPKVGRAEAVASAAMYLVETMAEVQVRTTYGLTHAGMAAMFRASADNLIQNSSAADDPAEEAGLLLMAKEISDMADRIEKEQ